MKPKPSSNHRIIAKNSILNEATFVRAIFKGQQKGKSVPWLQVTIRPVLIKQKRYLQISFFDDQKDISKNYTGSELHQQIDHLLRLPFKNIQIETTQGRIHIQFTKRGQAIIHQAQAATQAVNLAHNRAKAYLLAEHEPNPFLQAVGIMTQDGRVKSAMRRKFRQINAFLKLIHEANPLTHLPERPLHIVDFGCGNAYLTFALYHYFNEYLHRSAYLTGIDLKADLLQKHRQTSQNLGWSQMAFQMAQIINVSFETPPDFVMALHACDTATDEALYQAIIAQSTFIFAAPCCHKHLQRQLNQKPPPPPFGPVFQQGILRSRQSDILTDTFRALILRLMGYQTDVIEFISTEHTAKNLMIRAVKSSSFVSPSPAISQEYKALKAFWQVTPYLETLLGTNFTQRLT